MPILFDLKILLPQSGHRAVVAIEHDGVKLHQVLGLGGLILRRDDRRADRTQNDDGRKHSPR